MVELRGEFASMLEQFKEQAREKRGAEEEAAAPLGGAGAGAGGGYAYGGGGEAGGGLGW